MLIHVIDASIPPAAAGDLPEGTQGVLGYLGAAGRTPHVWAPSEWAPFQHLLQMGIWVPDFAGGPVGQASAAAAAAHALGFMHGRGIIGDFEDSADPAWIGEWGVQLRGRGYVPLAYESPGVLGANPRLDGVILAQPGSPGRVPPGQLIIGRQYAWDVPAGQTVVDLDVMDTSARMLFGSGAGFGHQR